ncbi:MAG TPA: SET domain-containing protein [Rhabdochlamydiaceae bacterium]|nr:SET domain-containing protein [Rhabdochlamydiaceae bacterium]
MRKRAIFAFCFLICAFTYLNGEETTKWSEYSVILQPAPTGGVGIFATHDMPEGMRVFTGKFSPKRAKTKEIPAAFLKYCVFIDDEECYCPERFDCMEIGWYINHSFDPNLIKIAEGHWVAARDIKAGEELLMDYNQLNEPENLKEPYYRIER